MEELKLKAINQIVDASIQSFVQGLDSRYRRELFDPNGVINSKKNNIFIAELGDEFIFYSAFVRSFDSSFGRVLENISNSIAKLSYDVNSGIAGYILPQQSQQIDYMMNSYETHQKPKVSDYQDYKWMTPKDTRSFERTHPTDNFFYDKKKNTYYIIELKAGGDLDNKKAKSEKIALLTQYFLFRNHLCENNLNDSKVKIYFATAYNKDGEGNRYSNDRVRQFFCDDELLIGKAYWNFVCDSEQGFDIVMEQYKKSAIYIKQALLSIKSMYFGA